MFNAYIMFQPNEADINTLKQNTAEKVYNSNPLPSMKLNHT